MNELKFEQIKDLIGDFSLIKGCFQSEHEINAFNMDEEGENSDDNDSIETEIIRKVAILYDCHILYFDDPDGEKFQYLKQRLLEKKVTLQQ